MKMFQIKIRLIRKSKTCFFVIAEFSSCSESLYKSLWNKLPLASMAPLRWIVYSIFFIVTVSW